MSSPIRRKKKKQTKNGREHWDGSSTLQSLGWSDNMLLPLYGACIYSWLMVWIRVESLLCCSASWHIGLTEQAAFPHDVTEREPVWHCGEMVAVLKRGWWRTSATSQLWIEVVGAKTSSRGSGEEVWVQRHPPQAKYAKDASAKAEATLYWDKSDWFWSVQRGVIWQL